MQNNKANFLHFLIPRWITLANVVFLYVSGIRKTSPLLFLLVTVYCLLLTLFGRRVNDLITKHPLLVQVDLLISAIILWLTGSSWMSPYFLYAITSLLIASFFLRIRDALLSTVFFCILYTASLVLDKATMAEIARNSDFDVLITSYASLFLLTLFFGYPAHIVHTIEKLQEDTSEAEGYLRETKGLIDTITSSSSLSCRELEILSYLSKGKTNSQIAAELYLSEATVKSHLYRIYKKLSISSREEAIVYFFGKSSQKDN